ncbi:MAG: thiamine-phosphate kinase [Acidobacteria bacterium]|nr:MAG: thiamine-phosphate kinase [Acidobacteriota bacterium]
MAPLGEKSLIERIRRRVRAGSAVVNGIGDDSAVLRVPAGHELLVTTDFTLENVHFRRQWHPPEVVGWRCLTRGLSDIAAMGGEPRAAFLSLALDGRTPQKWVNGFFDGLLEAASEFGLPLAGGDTAQSAGGIQADIVVVGSVPNGKAVLRSGARTADGVYVTGELGGSAAALAQLHTGKARPADYPRHFHPVARIAVGQWLQRRGLASGMIDISDGLSTDLEHICEESGVGAEIAGAAIPRARVGHRAQQVGLDLALHGGEDYELLFTSAKKIPAQVAGVPVTRIGRITRKRRMVLTEDDGARRTLEVRGWEHFKGN